MNGHYKERMEEIKPWSTQSNTGDGITKFPPYGSTWDTTGTVQHRKHFEKVKILSRNSPST